RLPNTFWCYDPQSEEPISDLPAHKNGYITFGSLNSFFKVNNCTIDLWARVMNQAPTSRMIILAPLGLSRERALARFETQGIARHRIEFATPQRRPEYLRQYHRIDVALDTLPYNGHTTSLDAFWMGVPVVTRIGERVVGRGGLSQLSNLQLTELAGH